jgi:hypothetical protein
MTEMRELILEAVETNGFYEASSKVDLRECGELVKAGVLVRSKDSHDRYVKAAALSA